MPNLLLGAWHVAIQWVDQQFCALGMMKDFAVRLACTLKHFLIHGATG